MSSLLSKRSEQNLEEPRLDGTYTPDNRDIMAFIILVKSKEHMETDHVSSEIGKYRSELSDIYWKVFQNIKREMYGKLLKEELFRSLWDVFPSEKIKATLNKL